MCTSNENLPKTKVVDLKSYTSLVFNTFSFEPRKIEKILDYREVSGISEIANRCLPSSPYLFPPPLVVRCRWTSSTAHLRPSGPTKASGDTRMSAWPLLAPTRVPDPLARRHAARHAPRRLLRPPHRCRARPGQTDLPQVPFSFASMPSRL